MSEIEEADIFVSIQIAVNMIRDAKKNLLDGDSASHVAWALDNALIFLEPWLEVLTDPAD